MESVERELDERVKAAYDENGVDRSLIRAHLALSPAERLARLERLLEDLASVRRAVNPR